MTSLYNRHLLIDSIYLMKKHYDTKNTLSSESLCELSVFFMNLLGKKKNFDKQITDTYIV